MANLNLRQETTGTTFGGDERGVGGHNECPEIFSRKDKLFDNLIEVNTPAIEPTPVVRSHREVEIYSVLENFANNLANKLWVD